VPFRHIKRKGGPASQSFSRSGKKGSDVRAEETCQKGKAGVSACSESRRQEKRGRREAIKKNTVGEGGIRAKRGILTSVRAGGEAR